MLTKRTYVACKWEGHSLEQTDFSPPAPGISVVASQDFLGIQTNTFTFRSLNSGSPPSHPRAAVGKAARLPWVLSSDGPATVPAFRGGKWVLAAAEAQPQRAASSPWARLASETCFGKSWLQATSPASLTRYLLFSGINIGKLATVYWQ